MVPRHLPSVALNAKSKMVDYVITSSAYIEAFFALFRLVD